MMKVPTSLVCMTPLPFGNEPPVPQPPMPTDTIILVHPNRWNAFYMAINQPDVFQHPEVRALLLGAADQQSSLDELRVATGSP